MTVGAAVKPGEQRDPTGPDRRWDLFFGIVAAGAWELGRVALVLGAWCVVGLVLCLVTFRWTDRDR